MHLLSLSEPLKLFGRVPDLAAGVWVCQDINAFEFGAMAKRGTAAANIYFKPVELGCQSVLFVRSGAWGDLLFLMPALKAYKAKYPERKIGLSCFGFRHPLFEGVSYIDELLPYPLPIQDAERYDAVITLENVMERDTELHATDAFAKYLEVQVEDYRPDYATTADERENAKKHFTGLRPVVGVQPRASIHNRDYPANKWLEVITKLESLGWEVVIFGEKGQIPPLPPESKKLYIGNLAEKGLSFRESAAVLSHCAAFVGVDSALLHLCHALDIPAIGLYAAFSWKIRTSKAPLTTALSGHGSCAPCNWHMHRGAHFPPDQHCAKIQRCHVLESIEPDRIVAKVDALKP